MEKYNVYLKKFQLAIIIIVVTVVAVIAMIVKTVPEVQKIIQIQEDQKTQSSALADAERKLADLKAEALKQEAEDANVAKLFFKPITEGLDSEAAISDEFTEILQIMRDNRIKVRSVNYEYDPKDDNFVKFIPFKYHVCRISAEMIANYSSLANFLREVYKHEHFLDLERIEIVPYNKNKKILLVNVVIKLYAQKDAATAEREREAADAAAKAASDAAKNADGNDSSKVPSPQPADGGVSPEATE